MFSGDEPKAVGSQAGEKLTGDGKERWLHWQAKRQSPAALWHTLDGFGDLTEADNDRLMLALPKMPICPGAARRPQNFEPVSSCEAEGREPCYSTLKSKRQRISFACNAFCNRVVQDQPSQEEDEFIACLTLVTHLVSHGDGLGSSFFFPLPLGGSPSYYTMSHAGVLGVVHSITLAGNAQPNKSNEGLIDRWSEPDSLLTCGMTRFSLCRRTIHALVHFRGTYGACPLHFMWL